MEKARCSEKKLASPHCVLNPPPRPDGNPAWWRHQEEVRLLCASVRTAPAPSAQSLTGPLTPAAPWQLGHAGRQEVWKQIRKNRVLIHEHVYEEEKKTRV